MLPNRSGKIMLPDAAEGVEVRIIPSAPTGSLETTGFRAKLVLSPSLELITHGKLMLPVTTFGKVMVPPPLEFGTAPYRNGPDDGSGRQGYASKRGKDVGKVTAGWGECGSAALSPCYRTSYSSKVVAISATLIEPA